MKNFRFSTSFATENGPWCGNDDEEQREEQQKGLLCPLKEVSKETRKER